MTGPTGSPTGAGNVGTEESFKVDEFNAVLNDTEVNRITAISTATVEFDVYIVVS